MINVDHKPPNGLMQRAPPSASITNSTSTLSDQKKSIASSRVRIKPICHLSQSIRCCSMNFHTVGPVQSISLFSRCFRFDLLFDVGIRSTRNNSKYSIKSSRKRNRPRRSPTGSWPSVWGAWRRALAIHCWSSLVITAKVRASTRSSLVVHLRF